MEKVRMKDGIKAGWCLVISMFFLISIIPFIVWQIGQTFSLFVFGMDMSKFYSISIGDPVGKVIANFGEPHERILFDGVRLSDQRNYDEILVYDGIDYEVQIYAKGGQVVFTALTTSCPLPLTSLSNHMLGRIFLCILIGVLIFVMFLLRKCDKKKITHRPFVWASLAAMLSIGNAYQPFFWLSRYSLIFSTVISITAILLWFTAIVKLILHYIEIIQTTNAVRDCLRR